MSDFESLLSEECRETIAANERDESIDLRLAEIEQAVKDGYMVEDENDSDCVYMVAKDFSDGEYVTLPKRDIAAMFVDAPEVYLDWKNGYAQYRAEKEARTMFPVFNGRKKNGGKD